MLSMVMSQAARGLLRALLDRGGAERHRILLTEICSDDWHSLTLEGERHRIQLRFSGPAAKLIVTPFINGIEDVDSSFPARSSPTSRLRERPSAYLTARSRSSWKR